MNIRKRDISPALFLLAVSFSFISPQAVNAFPITDATQLPEAIAVASAGVQGFAGSASGPLPQVISQSTLNPLSTASASATGSPFPVVFSSAAGSLATSVTLETYYFAVIGPETTLTTVNVSAMLGAFIFFPDGFSVSVALLQIIDSGGGSELFIGACSTTSNTSDCGTYPGSVTLNNFPMSILSNSLVTVQMTAEASTGIVPFNTMSASFVDPYITLDSEFLKNNPGYTLAFSANITNAPAAAPVPEPTSLSILLLALTGLALIARFVA